MKLIVLDSSGNVAGAAIVSENAVLAEYTVNHKKTHSQTLLPMLDEIVKMSETDLSEIDAIALAAGPGSFTGLRIGSATVKGLGLALNKPVVEVPTCDGLAYNLYIPGEAVICPLMDARRGEVYTGIYEFAGNSSELYSEETGEGFRAIEEQFAGPVSEVIEKINALGRPVVYLGDGVPVHCERLKEETKVPCSFAPAHLALQRAGAVGMLAVQLYKAGRTVSASEHAPTYLRLSQAERERAEREKA